MKEEGHAAKWHSGGPSVYDFLGGCRRIYPKGEMSRFAVKHEQSHRLGRPLKSGGAKYNGKEGHAMRRQGGGSYVCE